MPDAGDHRLRRKDEQQSHFHCGRYPHIGHHGHNLGWGFNAEYGDCAWFRIDRDDHCDYAWFHIDRDDHCDPSFSSLGVG